MSKTYFLKSWDEVDGHHFISKERWNALGNVPLEAKFFEGFLSTTALVHPKGEEGTLSNSFMVSKEDLRELKDKAPVNPDSTPDPSVTKEKTYTKDDVRKAGMRAMSNITDDTEAIMSAIAIASLINELN